MPRGRSSEFTQEIGDRICQRIATSTDSLGKICAEDGMPVHSTVFLWLTRNPDFSKQYARAKEQQMELMAEQLLEIADDGLNDFKEKDGSIVVDQEHINRSRLRVDTRKWLMSKLAPKKFGDKVQQEISGPDGTAPVLTIQLAPTPNGISGNQPSIAPKAIAGVIEPGE